MSHRNLRFLFLFFVAFVGLANMHLAQAQSDATPDPAPTPSLEQQSAVIDLLLSANQNFAGGNHETAIDEFNEVLAIDPGNWTAYYGIGDVYFHFLADCDSAIAAYRYALALEPIDSKLDNPAAYSAYGRIGACVDWAGDQLVPVMEEAQEVFPLPDDSPLFLRTFVFTNEAQELGFIRDATNYYHRGQAHFYLNNLDAAAADYTEGLRHDPEGFALFLYNTALDAFESSATEVLNNALFHLNVLIGSMDDILNSESDQAVRVATSAYLLRGIFLERLGDIEAAAADYYAYILAQRPERNDDSITFPADDFTLEMREGLANYLSFDGQAGAIIDISASSAAAGEVDPLIVLLSPDGTPLIGNDDQSSESGNSQISGFELLVDGTYLLIVSHAGGESDGNLDISANITPADTSDTSDETCVVSTDQAQTVALHVGPGENRSSVAFLPVGLEVAVSGVFVTDDGDAWFQLNKEQAAPQSAATELWMHRGDANETGNCDNIGETAAPPIIPIAVQPPTQVPGSTAVPQTDNLITPNAGTWLVAMSENATILCPGQANQLFPTFGLTGPAGAFNVSPAAGGIAVDGRVLTRIGSSNVFEGIIGFFLGATAQTSITFTSAAAGTATATVNVNFDGQPCRGTFTFTMRQ